MWTLKKGSFDEVDEPRSKDFAVGNVGGERRLVRDRLRLAVRHHSPVVDAVRQFPEVSSGRSEQVVQFLRRHLSQLAHGANVEPLEDAPRDFADAPNSSDGQRIEKRLDLIGGHDDEPVGLPDVARDLGEELVRIGVIKMLVLLRKRLEDLEILLFREEIHIVDAVSCLHTGIDHHVTFVVDDHVEFLGRQTEQVTDLIRE